MKKLGARTLPTVTRVADESQPLTLQPQWVTDLASSLLKSSVQPRREESVFEQISAVMNNHNRPRYSSVDDAVKEMQERSGLMAYQRSMTASGTQSASQTKKAHAQVKVFELCPQVQQTCDNYIEDSRGNLAIPSIVERIKRIHKNDVTDDAAWDEEQFLKYLNDKNIEAKQKNPDHEAESMYLGRSDHFGTEDIDPSNSNALIGLMPVKL